MNITQSINLQFSLLIILIASLIGCAPSPREFQMQYDKIDKIPLRAGLYIDNKFKEYVPSQCELCHKFPPGIYMETLIKSTENMTKQAFRDVVILLDKSDSAIQQVNVLISPEIDSIYADMSEGGAVKIKMKWTITSTDGKVLYMETFIGESGFPCRFSIKDQLNKAFKGITKNKWWEAIAPY